MDFEGMLQGRRGKKPSFYLFGSSSFCIECIEILLINNFKPLGIVTKDHNVREYTKLKDIPLYSNPEEILDSKKPDYIFSVYNEFILSANILKFPNKLSINFHNAPLPKYAGVNATSWAIINGEKKHGVTWHLMNDKLDAGDIVKQKIFSIDKQDTRTTLDIKCIKYGKSSFKELISDILSKNIRFKVQNINFRTIYTYNDLPETYGILNWSHSTDRIERLIRALTFEMHDNIIGIPKVLIGKKIYGLTRHLVDSTKSRKNPGTILAIKQNGIKVATADYDFWILGIQELPSGNNVALPEIFKDKTNSIGKKITPLKLETIVNYGKKFSINIKNELDMVKSVNTYSEHWLGGSTSNANKKKYTTETISINDLLRSKSESLNKTRLITALILVFLYKVNNYEQFIINFSLAKDQLHSVSNLFLENIILNINFDDNESLYSAYNEINSLLERWDKSRIINDISVRYKSLKSLNIPNINLILGENTKKLVGNIVICISNDEVSISCDENSLSREKISVIKSMVKFLKNFRFENILDDKTKLNNISIIANKDKNKLCKLGNLNDLKKNDESLIKIFKRMAKNNHARTAVFSDTAFYSYKFIDYKSDQLAALLIKYKVKMEACIAVYLSPSVEYIISILGILKAGGAYLPLDSIYGRRVIEKIIINNKVNYIITNNLKLTEISTFKKLNINFINIDLPLTAKFDKVKLIKTTPENLAYVMFTSGTTGEPKGVLIEQKSIVRLVCNTSYVRISKNDRFLFGSNPAFDASTFEIWGALLNGASLGIISKEDYLSPFKLESYLKKFEISILWLTSGYFDRLSNIIPKAFRSLKYLIVGGDIVKPSAVNKIKNNNFGPKFILNGYGPTENATFSTIYRISTKRYHISSIPIGKPINGTGVAVLDKFHNLVPLGVHGEVYVTGLGVARGYLNNDKLSNEKFKDIKILDSHTRCYKTGDLARWNIDNNLEYLGRVDNQLKVNGFRIEVGAIEQKIIEFPNVKECCVLALNGDHGSKILTAFIQPKNKKILIKLSKLSDFLSRTLPLYMEPQQLVFLDSLPITANGKIDKNYLSNYQIDKPKKDSSLDKPRSELEKKLIKLWSKLFHTNNIGIHDNFMHLGGSSLLIADLSVWLFKYFKYELSITNFLKNPTVEYLSSLIQANKKVELKNHIYKHDINLIKDFKFRFNLNKSEKNNAVLLTGANGFLGRWLVKSILSITDRNLYCIVKSGSIDKFVSYLHTLSENLELKYDIFSRVSVVNGDLSKERIGINAKTFDYLANHISDIIHCGAYVHHIYNYELLREHNVLSTYELIKFANLKVSKNIHYISSLSVGLSIKENFSDDYFFGLPNGYAQTKWVSEMLLSSFKKRGGSINIFRPGWIMPDLLAKEDLPNNNHFKLFLKGCVQLKKAPLLDKKINMLPVDVLSDAIINASLNSKERGVVYNFYNDYSPNWLDVINWTIETGDKIELVDSNLWLKNYLLKIKSDNFLYQLLPSYVNGQYKYTELFSNMSFTQNQKNMLTMLNVDRDYFKRHVKKMLKD